MSTTNRIDINAILRKSFNRFLGQKSIPCTKENAFKWIYGDMFITVLQRGGHPDRDDQERFKEIIREKLQHLC